MSKQVNKPCLIKVNTLSKHTRNLGRYMAYYIYFSLGPCSSNCITLLMSQILHLNLHGKMVQNVYTYQSILKITKQTVQNAYRILKITKTGFRYIQLSNHQQDIIIEFILKNSIECVYIYSNSKNYQIDIIVEITLKNRSWAYIIHPCSVIVIKVIISHYNHQTDITVKFSTECIYIPWNFQNYQIRLVQFPNRHHSWIHIEKWRSLH